MILCFRTDRSGQVYSMHPDQTARDPTAPEGAFFGSITVW